jgi:hypothetical protein
VLDPCQSLPCLPLPNCPLSLHCFSRGLQVSHSLMVPRPKAMSWSKCEAPWTHGIASPLTSAGVGRAWRGFQQFPPDAPIQGIPPQIQGMAIRGIKAPFFTQDQIKQPRCYLPWTAKGLCRLCPGTGSAGPWPSGSTSPPPTASLVVICFAISYIRRMRH